LIDVIENPNYKWRGIAEICQSGHTSFSHPP